MVHSKWAKRRQIIYAVGVLLFFSAIIGPIVFFSVYEAPSCFDGKLNQEETDVDRGGPCQLLDERTVSPHAILWSRAFPVRDGFYNAVAYVENPNQEAGVYDAAYQFKLYDERNILIAERFGRVSVPPGQVFPIFESRIDTGNRVPIRTFFSFVNRFSWERMTDPVQGVVIQNEQLLAVDTAPRLEALVSNTTIRDKENIVVVATLFDEAGNAFASSRTLIERLTPQEQTSVVFTWPHPFSLKVARVDVVALGLPER